jgi:putative mRNA 3-end processing factor
MDHYICHNESKEVLKYRLGNDISISTEAYGKPFNIKGVNLSFHPAGHIIGSAQIKVEYKGEIWVASGDYKIENDGISPAFEPIKCHTFISESTFGLPIFKWKPQAEIFSEINKWWEANKEHRKASVLIGYSLGKAQRLLQNIDHSIGPVYAHGAVQNMNDLFRKHYPSLPLSTRVSSNMPKSTFRGALILAPSSAIASPWLNRFEPYSLGIASGWMALRGARRRKAADQGFALSDHADWNDLNIAIKETGAERVYVTHGYTATFARWLREQGLEAHEAKTEYEGELAEINISEESATEESNETRT